MPLTPQVPAFQQNEFVSEYLCIRMLVCCILMYRMACVAIELNSAKTVDFKFGPTFYELFHALFELVVILIFYNKCSYPDTVRLRYS